MEFTTNIIIFSENIITGFYDRVRNISTENTNKVRGGQLFFCVLLMLCREVYRRLDGFFPPLVFARITVVFGDIH